MLLIFYLLQQQATKKKHAAFSSHTRLFGITVTHTHI